MPPPLVVAVDPAAFDAALLDAVATLLREGGLVAFPTETVYGLGANALDPDAVARVFRAKGRPADNPLIVHLADASHLDRVAASVTPLAAELAARFWPGPLTVVLEARPDVPRGVTAGLGTVAVRVPDHPVALALLAAAGVPVAAPSANRSGRPSPTTAAHVLDDLAGAVDAVVDGGPCRVGLESTVVDARGATPQILREGAVTREALAEALGRGAVDGPVTAEAGVPASSPGTRHAHYQPGCAVVVAAAADAAAVATGLLDEGKRVGAIVSRPAPAGVVEVGRFSGAAELAVHLYGWLRAAERVPVDVVVVEAVAEAGVGRAVMDRLRRAAGG